MAGFIAERRSRAKYEDVRWTIADEDYLAEVVAIVALGQAAHAASLIAALEPMAPVFNTDQLRTMALAKLQIQPGTDSQIEARRWHRDGLLFEVLSWIALLETYPGERYLIRDPHLGATTQGLDGLLLELNAGLDELVRTVIVEDKCSENPRSTFQSKVLPAFQEHHANKRAPDLVATAASLLGRLADSRTAVERAAAVLDLRRRGYRGSLALETEYDASSRRDGLFAGYDSLEGMVPANLEGGGFVVGEELRTWFDGFARRVQAKLVTMEVGDVV